MFSEELRLVLRLIYHRMSQVEVKQNKLLLVPLTALLVYSQDGVAVVELVRFYR